MIYLYSLPSMSFNAPNIGVPLIKGYLELSNLETKQFDLSLDFLQKCISTKYFKTNFKKYYINLSGADKKIIDDIDNNLKIMKSSKIDTNKIILANEKVEKYLSLFSGYYSFSWKRRDLYFDRKINTVEELLEFSFDKTNKIFDDIFNIDYIISDKDIFYISVQYPYQLPYAIRLSNIIKHKNNKVKIIFGGDYITHIIKNSKKLMEECNCIDAICFYGNYESLVKLIKLYKKDIKEINVDNTCIRHKKNIIFNNTNKKDKLDINKYIPNFDDLDLDNYLSNLKMIPLTLNHGCYHSKCTFCSRYYFYNGYCKYNTHKILEFIKNMYRNNSIEAIYFVDECVPPQLLIELANYLIENNIKIKWIVETRIEKEYLDNSISKLLYQSGCREISFGIESYNQRILNDMNKNTQISTIKKVLKNFYQSGIVVSATFMIGYPTENLFNIYKTLFFIKHYKYIDTFGLGVFNYMRNSILVNNSGIDETNDLNLIYRTNDDNNGEYMNLIHKFNLKNKIRSYSDIRKKILYRSEYMYLDRTKYSLNYKG